MLISIFYSYPITLLGFIVIERNGLGVDMFVSKNYHLYPLFTVFRKIQNNSCHCAYT